MWHPPRLCVSIAVTLNGCVCVCVKESSDNVAVFVEFTSAIIIIKGNFRSGVSKLPAL